MKFMLSHIVYGYIHHANGQTSAHRFLEETELNAKTPTHLMQYIRHYVTIGTFSSVKISLN